MKKYTLIKLEHGKITGNEKRYTVTVLAPSRFIGVYEAARELNVGVQTVYNFLNRYNRDRGKKKRTLLAIVDESK